ncbi:MAG: endo-1,4-beta-xylanase [Terriglobales bacterium]
MFSKTRILVVPVSAFYFALAASAPSPSPQSLRDAAQHSGMLIGAAARPARLSETAYAATLAREFNMLEPEDALKWEVLRPDPRAFDFRQADQLVDFALRYNMKVRGHTLVWHQQNPAWLTAGHFTPGQLSKLLETHIKTVVGHYRGKIFAWDVANEAFDEGNRSGQLRSTIWYDRPGIGYAGQGSAYLAQCFRWAREADPEALLFYNEAEAEEINRKSDAVYAMIREFKRQGVPIDGVGLQMHLGSTLPNIVSISANIARFAALGVQVHITEMDVSLPIDPNGNASIADLQTQADIYRQVAEACLSRPGCTAIQTWGFTDKYSWIGSHSKQTRGAALLFDRDYRPKPAYEALRQAFLKGR